jgi:hypothetical protein
VIGGRGGNAVRLKRVHGDLWKAMHRRIWRMAAGHVGVCSDCNALHRSDGVHRQLTVARREMPRAWMAWLDRLYSCSPKASEEQEL